MTHTGQGKLGSSHRECILRAGVGVDTQRATSSSVNRSNDVSTARKLSQLRLHNPEEVSSKPTLCKGNGCSRNSCTTFAALPQALQRRAATFIFRICTMHVLVSQSSCSCLEGRGLGALSSCGTENCVNPLQQLESCPNTIVP